MSPISAYTYIVREYQARESSLTVKLGFCDLLSNLPVPGTDEFSDLRLSLKPFGMRSDRYSVEPSNTNQTTKLSDVRINYSLMNDTLIFRVAYDGIEIVIPTVAENSHEIATVIAETILASLKEHQQTAVSTASVQSTAHLEIEPHDPRHYLAEQFRIGDAKLVPDAFAVEVEPLEGSPVKSCRIVIAKSLRFPAALFLDFVAGYEWDDSFVPSDFLVSTQNDYATRLELLGLSSSRGTKK